MPRAGAQVGYGVSWARIVVVEREVMVKTLVESLDAKEVGRQAGCGGGSFSLPEHIGDVIGGCPQGSLLNIGKGGNDVVTSNVATQLEVAVGDGVIRLSERHEGGLRHTGEWMSPQEWLDVTSNNGNKEHASHSRPGRIAGAGTDDA